MLLVVLCCPAVQYVVQVDGETIILYTLMQDAVAITFSFR
jgi:hypothetical protein